MPAEDRALFDALLLMLGGDSLVSQTIEHIRRGVTDFNHLVHTLDIQLFHSVKNHVRGRAAPLTRNNFNIYGKIHESIFYPTQSIHNRLGNFVVEACIGCNLYPMFMAPTKCIRGARYFPDLVMIVLNHKLLISIKGFFCDLVSARILDFFKIFYINLLSL